MQVLEEYCRRRWRTVFKADSVYVTPMVRRRHSDKCRRNCFGQVINHEGEQYNTRMAIQYSKVGKKTLEERAYEIADRMISSRSDNCDIREELKKAILTGYNLHQEGFDDE